MSLWTPSGEHPVGDDRRSHATGGRSPGAPPGPGAPGTGQGAPGTGQGAPGTGQGAPGTRQGAPGDGPTAEELRRQLLDAPAEVVIANHCYGIFELAAVYLSASPPRLDQARLAIDALGSLVDGLGARLGEPHASLRDALAQIRLAYVQIASVHEGATPVSDADAAPGTPDGTGDGARVGSGA